MMTDKIERGEDGFWHGYGAELLNYIEGLTFHKLNPAEAEIMLMLAKMTKGE